MINDKYLRSFLSNLCSAHQLMTNPEKIKEVMNSISRKTWLEILETGDMMEILWKMSIGAKVEEEEKQRAYQQAKDIAKTVPAFGIFLLPGGMILLPILAKILPWDLIPSAFKSEPDENEKNSHDGTGEQHLKR